MREDIYGNTSDDYTPDYSMRDVLNDRRISEMPNLPED